MPTHIEHALFVEHATAKESECKIKLGLINLYSHRIAVHWLTAIRGVKQITLIDCVALTYSISQADRQRQLAI